MSHSRLQRLPSFPSPPPQRTRGDLFGEGEGRQAPPRNPRPRELGNHGRAYAARPASDPATPALPQPRAWLCPRGPELAAGGEHMLSEDPTEPRSLSAAPRAVPT